MWHTLISIHALREEGDLYLCARLCVGDHISIHALREEGDDVLPVWCRLQESFLSTPSARRATYANVAVVQGSGISIHALREEGDGLAP